MAPITSLDKVFQVCVVVNDLQKTIEEYWNIFGLGPWRIWDYDPTVVADMTYHGEPQDYAMTIALAQAGPVQWEVVQPVWGESVFADFLREHGDGLHHIGVFIDGAWQVVEDLKAIGVNATQSGFVKGRPFIYLDTVKRLGACFELVGTGGYDIPPHRIYPSAE
jgi:methylmalonyl-CoA/ethylmalonyl-CoA epimerase